MARRTQGAARRQPHGRLQLGSGIRKSTPLGSTPPGHSGEDRLAAFYNQRAVLHPEHPLTPQRVEQRERFIARLKAEGRHGVLEIGSGLGLDGLKFVQAGIHYTGVDLSEEQVRSPRPRA